MKKSYLQAAGLFLCLLALICTARVLSMPDITRYEIIIPNLTKEYEMLFLTDNHVVVPDATDNQQEKNYVHQRYFSFLSREGTSSAEQLQHWFDFANDEKVDGLLLGGDIIDTPSNTNLAYLDAHLKELAMPYIYTLGNHDWTYPWEYMTEAGKQQYLPLLAHYMDGDPAIHSLDFGEFLIVSVDNSSNQINAAAMDSYRQILSGDKPVILMLHVPLQTDSLLKKTRRLWKHNPVVLGDGTKDTVSANTVSKEFIELTTAADSPVELILAGHVHLPDESTVEGGKPIIQIVGDAAFRESGILLHISGG